MCESFANMRRACEQLLRLYGGQTTGECCAFVVTGSTALLSFLGIRFESIGGGIVF